MNKQDTLKPLDLVVAIALSVEAPRPPKTYAQLGAELGVSPSRVHEAVERLGLSGLLRVGTRNPNRHALRNFLAHGVQYAFPPQLGRKARGFPTAYAGPVLAQMFDYTTSMVWPDHSGTDHGTALNPLYPNAVSLPERWPGLYRTLTLVDAIRVGRARERKAALAALEETFSKAQGIAA